MTVIFFGMITICVIFYKQLGWIQRIILGYVFLFTLRKWEEMRVPGGFTDLMVKFIGIKANSDQLAAVHIPVVILLLVITFVPFLIHKHQFWHWYQFILVSLNFIHLTGIKLPKTEKPYTPGMITGLCLGLHPL